MSKPTRIKAEAVAFVPQHRDACVQAVQGIGEAQRERLRIETAMNDEIAAIKTRYEEQARPYAEQIKALSQGVQTWCEAHRDELLTGKSKTVNLASGEVKWRTRPPRVSVRNVAGVLEALKNLKLKRFIRTKEEINKEAILDEPEVVANLKGISITQKEDFVIVPFETELESVL